MRRFAGSSGMGWGSSGSGFGGGPNGGGGGMFRTVSRVARAGMSSNLQDPSSPSSSSSSSHRNASKRGLTLSSTAIAPSLVSLSTSVQGFGPACPRSSSSSLCDDSEWVCVRDDFSVEDGHDSFDDRIFGSVPSSHEVTTALLSLQQVLTTSSSSDMDWIEPSWNTYGYDQRVSPGIGRVYDALHLLQTDSSVQRMVISLSSDRAVWDAVLNNEAVQELRESFFRGEADDLESSDDESEPDLASSSVVRWIFNSMRSKFMEFLSGITNLMKEAFEPQEQQQEQQTDDFTDVFREKVRAAFMLTAIVLLIVVISRASHG